MHKTAPRVIAHRGAWRASGLPQNSLASLRRAIALGCDGSECDVRLTADNVLVVTHDADWCGLPIATSTCEQLRAHPLANGELLPCLADFLSEITREGCGQTKLIIELKDSTLGPAHTQEAVRLLVAEVNAAAARSQVEYILFDYEAAQLLLAIDPQAQVAFLRGDIAPERLHADGFTGLDYELCVLRKEPRWLEQAARLGLETNVWTVNAPADMQALVGQGVGSITTDEPEQLLEILHPAANGLPRDPGLVVFAYSDVGYACLKLILERGVRVRAVFTHEDSPEEAQWFGSVSALAAMYGVPVYRPQKLTRAEHESLIFDTLGARLLLSFYYRNLLPTWLWSGMALGAFNMHGSYLPSYRGRAPLNWAIINGEDHTGVTLHFMVKEADAGDIVDQEKVSIGPEETAISVRERACSAAVRVMERQLGKLLSGTAPRHRQDESLISYFGRRTPEDGRIDWSKSAREVFNLVRALTRPYPGAFTEFPLLATSTAALEQVVPPSGQPSSTFATQESIPSLGETPPPSVAVQQAVPPIAAQQPVSPATSALPQGRLLVWWGRVREDLHGTPGTVLCAQPLTIACGSGAFEITDSEPVAAK